MALYSLHCADVTARLLTHLLIVVINILNVAWTLLIIAWTTDVQTVVMNGDSNAWVTW